MPRVKTPTKSSAWLAALLWLLFLCPALAAEPDGRHIGVFGDSLGDGVWSGLYTVLKPHPEDKLFRHAKIGAGLTRSDFESGWLADFAAALDADKITVAVVMVGANDQQNIRDADRKGYVFPSDGWKRIYAARVDLVLAELAKRKIAAIWVGLPIMRKTEMNDGAVLLDAIFADAARRAGVGFLPLVDSFKGADGGFASHLPDARGRLRQVRLEDGIHFTGYGYELVAAMVYQAITVADTPAAPPLPSTP